MKVSLSRLSSVVVSLFVLIGCAAGGQENPKAFTVANLQGSYDLNTDAMPSNPAGDDGFNMISEMLDIDANTLTFAPTFAGMGPFTLTGRTLTVTRSNGYADVIQATSHDTGNTLTLIDEINEDVETFVFIRRDKTGTSNEVTGANLQGTNFSSLVLSVSRGSYAKNVLRFISEHAPAWHVVVNKSEIAAFQDNPDRAR